MPITVRSARENNLRGVDLTLPTGQLIVFTGPSGSGKSSLALDTLHAEGRRRLLDALSTSQRTLVGTGRRPAVDAISGLPPTLAVAQRGGATAGVRTTVGTLTDVSPLLRILYARRAAQRCPTCGREVTPRSPEAIVAELATLEAGTRLTVLAPQVRGQPGSHHTLLRGMLEQGFVRARVDGAVVRIEELAPLDARAPHDVDVVIDRVRAGPGKLARLAEAVRSGLRAGRGRLVVDVAGEERFYSEQAWCGHCGVSWPPLSPRLLNFNHPDGACPGCQGLGSIALEDGSQAPCSDCGGGRLGPIGAAARLGGLGLPALSALPLAEVAPHLAALGELDAAVAPVLEEIRRRLAVLEAVGLGYLALDRAGPGLSSGELQRVRLAACAGSQLTGVLYILDEPTAGLGTGDTRRLVALLRALVTAGSSVLVVEHDAAVVAAADHVVDFGPGAGPEGGEVVFQGSPAALLEADTATGRWLSGRASGRPWPWRTPRRYLTLRGAAGHNLAGIDVRFPLRCLSAVTGPSGAGKSTLVFETLQRALSTALGQPGPPALPHAGLTGAEGILRVVAVDDTPVGRSPRSMTATILTIWAPIRRLYAATREARVRGFGESHFSLAHRGGRCEACKGQGAVEVDLGFIAGVYTPCEVCEGRRYGPETLAVRYRDQNLAEVLRLSVAEARARFAGHPAIERPLAAADAVGLGYLVLGQGAQTLSGGEARRLKLARELGRGGDKSSTLLLLDEPAAGLHPRDVAGVAGVLHQLVDAGATVIAVEHDPGLVEAADREIQLGPGAGPEGGRVVYTGPPRVTAPGRAQPG